MPQAPVFFDTWGWCAFFNPTDDHHEFVKSLWESLRGDTAPILTSWNVITETIGFACSGRGVREWARDGGYQVGRTFHDWVQRELFAAVLLASEAQLKDALALRLRHGAVPKLSHVDCVTAVLLRDIPACRLLSGDSHFQHLLPGVSMLP